MNIRIRIFLGFSLVLAATFYFLITWILNDVNVAPKKSMEEGMVDYANILASFLEQRITGDEIQTGELSDILDDARRRALSARIYELEKRDVNLKVYITNHQGIIIYNSDHPEKVGEDYSSWNDVRRTLEGRYGARTTRSDPEDLLSSVAYVAAPICNGDQILGVLSVGKSWQSITSFIESTRKKIILMGILGFAFILILSYIISIWITLPVKRLTDYARSVRDGLRLPFPRLGRGEIKVLGDSFEEMRETLEGKQYIEKYIQTLTHQIKGPLSSIKGAAELLTEEMPEEDRGRFIRNISTESERIQRLIDRLLQLASIEKIRELEQKEMLDLVEIVTDVIDSLSSVMRKRDIQCHFKYDDSLEYRISGDRFLIRQCVLNLTQNALEFSPIGGNLDLQLSRDEDGSMRIMVEDDGPGIPDYALPQVFERFYSLQRPDTGNKSSGLGLSLVKEVMTLHDGKVVLKNRSPRGTAAILHLPQMRG